MRTRHAIGAYQHLRFGRIGRKEFPAGGQNPIVRLVGNCPRQRERYRIGHVGGDARRSRNGKRVGKRKTLEHINGGGRCATAITVLQPNGSLAVAVRYDGNCSVACR